MQKKNINLLKLAPLELLVAAVLFMASVFAFSFIVHEALFEREDEFDLKVIHYFSAHSWPSLITWMERVTFFGSSTFLLPAYLVLTGFYLFKKNYRYVSDIAVIGISSTAIMFALKKIFHRHRPDMPILKGISGYSFPSGHSLSSFIFATILLYLLWQESRLPKGWKFILTAIFVLYPIIVGLSRIILNVHYATDVIGGFCLGTAWVIAIFFLMKKIRQLFEAKRHEPI